MYVLSNASCLNAKPTKVVFELDVLLRCVPEPPGSSPTTRLQIGSNVRYVDKRKGADMLLNWASRIVPIGIWTSHTKKYTHTVLKIAFPAIKFDFVYSRRSCAVHNDTYVKNLNMFRKHILLVDASASQFDYMIASSHKHMSLECAPFDGTADGELKRVLWTLQKILTTQPPLRVISQIASI